MDIDKKCEEALQRVYDFVDARIDVYNQMRMFDETGMIICKPRRSIHFPTIEKIERMYDSLPDFLKPPNQAAGG